MTPIKTLIYLHRNEPPQASWIIIDSENAAPEVMIHSTLDQLPRHAKQTQITLIVPAEEVVLSSAALPKLNRSRLMQALPYALEEQLIDDVNDLHFAIADYQTDGTLPVAITAKNKMAAWLALCKQYEIHPIKLISSVFSLPLEPMKWYVSIDNETCVARTGTYSGFGCDKNNLPTLLDLEISPDTQVEMLHFTDTHFLEEIAKNCERYPSINLLQGDYQTQRNLSEIKKIWRYAGYATLAWLGFTLISHLISFSLLHHQTSGLQAQIDSIYRRNFPDASAIVAPRERMEGKLNQLQNQSDKMIFWHCSLTLAKVSNPPRSIYKRLISAIIF
jgi:general secretion pathway protein L